MFLNEMQIYEVSQINEIIKAGFDNSPLFRNLCIRGEIFNIKYHSSGHIYFSLKDSSSTIKCVMFRSYTSKLRFRPDNGQVVLACGYISAYPRDGIYQLYCSDMSKGGEGDLQLKLEDLKKKLTAEGLFDDSHKKKLPAFPKTIAVITSPTGAAVRDIIRIIKSRWKLSDIIIVPVTVQGEAAENEVSEAIRLVNRLGLADLIITGRGGGSAEDLWAFNGEKIVRAIYESGIPVISAVGHEPDTCLSDFAADVRASTPSNAAELAVPDHNSMEAELAAFKQRLISSAERKLTACALLIKPLSESAVLSSPERVIDIKRIDIQREYDRISSSIERIIAQKRGNADLAAGKLDILSPLKQFDRGYSLAKKDGKLITGLEQINAGDSFSLILKNGYADCSVNRTYSGDYYGSDDI